jgi:hypothetical protein
MISVIYSRLGGKGVRVGNRRNLGDNDCAHPGASLGAYAARPLNLAVCLAPAGCGATS